MNVNPVPMNSPGEVLAAMRPSERFLVTSHANPDGDAIGSVLAMAALLRALGKRDITCSIDGAVPRIYEWLPGAASLVPPERVSGPFDVAVIVDAGSWERTGLLKEQARSAARTVVIDHHLEPPPEGDLNCGGKEHAASAEVVAELFSEANLPVPPDAALCLYVALITDTGGFRYQTTTPKSHRIAASLIETGIDVGTVTDRVFNAMSREKVELLKRMLNRMDICEEGRVAVVEFTQRDMDEIGAKDEDLDNLINIGRSIEGVQAAILLREVKGGRIKASLRSRPSFNSAEAVRGLGGGGHAGAAGVTLERAMPEVREALLREVRRILESAP